MSMFSMWLAFTLRLDTPHWPQDMQWAVYALGPILALPIFIRLGLYRAIFRYTGIAALLTIGKAVALYGTLIFGILLTAQWDGVPRSVGMLQPLILLLLVGSSRSLGWLWLAGRPSSAQCLLIYGAGNAGAQTAAALQSMRQYKLMGFIDDDDAKIGSTINGSKVYSPRALRGLVDRLRVTDVLLAIPSSTPQRRHQIIAGLQDLPVRVRTLPGLSDLASGRVTVTDFQDLDIEDLIGRTTVSPNPALLRKNIQNKTVLITGAGGSIGSELCRQISGQAPLKIILMDHSEYALYSIHHELESLREQGMHTCELVPLLASVRNLQRISNICDQHRPDTIYHTAAYKHVPMVEANPCEGILNNVFGTLNMVRVAIENEVNSFVLVSTDKAVRPTNIMGSSKRVAELILQAVTESSTNPFVGDQKETRPLPQSRTCFSIVRFGNVIGSSGSVIPLFRRQIAAGGPVTVTHPEATRYFMTIAEAAQLVLQAGAMAEGGEVFVLDMGEPIHIMELAKRMITLSGLTYSTGKHPANDIEIKITGLRPGEKLSEELLIGKDPMPTQHPRILQAREENLPWHLLETELFSLKEACLQNNIQKSYCILQKIASPASANI